MGKVSLKFIQCRDGIYTVFFIVKKREKKTSSITALS